MIAIDLKRNEFVWSKRTKKFPLKIYDQGGRLLTFIFSSGKEWKEFLPDNSKYLVWFYETKTKKRVVKIYQLPQKKLIKELTDNMVREIFSLEDDNKMSKDIKNWFVKV